MNVDLRYGSGATLRLELPDERLLALCAAPLCTLVDASAATDRALERPLDYPPLAQAVVPGDKVVLALCAELPRAAAVASRVVASLIGSGVAARDIALVRAPVDSELDASESLDDLSAPMFEGVSCELHDSRARKSLSYLGASASGSAIYINRLLHDADLVIPIGCVRFRDSPGYFGVNSTIFPAFSDAATIARYRGAVLGDAHHRRRLQQEADELGWLLGARFAIQVVPGPNGEVLDVLAGDIDAVERAGAQAYAKHWLHRVPARADLVAAAIDGAAEQTWENVGRALWSAGPLLSDGGAVVICTELDERPGLAVRQIAAAENRDRAVRKIERAKHVDSLVAIELANALDRGKVYLVSQLDEELVEDLGMTPIDASQVSRLAARHASTIVLASAHCAVARLTDEPAASEHLAQGRPQR